MKEEKDEIISLSSNDIYFSSITGSGLRFGSVYTRTVQIVWNPKEDITTYELALSIPFINRHGSIYEYEIDNTKSFFRHFDIHYTA